MFLTQLSSNPLTQDIIKSLPCLLSDDRAHFQNLPYILNCVFCLHLVILLYVRSLVTSFNNCTFGLLFPNLMLADILSSLWHGIIYWLSVCQYFLRLFSVSFVHTHLAFLFNILSYTKIRIRWFNNGFACF